MASRLTDGQPLTLEWLNSIIADLENLRSTVASEDSIRRPTTYTGALKSYTKVQMEARVIDVGVTIPKAGLPNKTYTFATAFKSSPILTVTMLRSGNGVIPVQIKSVTKTGFTVNFAPCIPVAEVSGAKISYIAVGESV